MSQVIRRIISTTKAAKPVGPYSQAVAVNSTLYVAGQVGFVPETMEIPAPMDVQFKQALSNLDHILEAAGSSSKKVVKTTVLLADMKDFATMNTIYGSYFSAPLPARTAYQVANLPMGAKIEIEVIALLGDVKDV